MNILAPDKQLWLYRLLAYGHGVRESSKIAGVNRGTAARYLRAWLPIKPQLQAAYDHLHDGDCEAYDKLVAPLPDQMVRAMADAWLDDQFDQPKSKFWTRD